MPRTPRSPESVAEKVRLLSEHNRCKTSYLVRPRVRHTWSETLEDFTDQATVEVLARIHIVRPPQGHGERALRVGVQSWHNGEVSYHYAEARGYGYDKLSDALEMASIGGHVLVRGRDTLLHLADKEGWTILGDVG